MTALALALAGSPLLAIASGVAAVPLPDVLRHLHAGVSGGTIAAADVTDHTLVWRLRVPRSQRR